MSLLQPPSHFWTRLSLAKQWLIQATTPGELVRVGKAANKVLQDAAKTAEWALEVQQEAAMIRIWALYLIGEILATTERQGVGRPKKDSRGNHFRPRLKDWGVTPTIQNRASLVYAIGREQLQALLDRMRREGSEITLRGVLKAAPGTRDDTGAHVLLPPDIRAPFQAEFHFDTDPCPPPSARPPGYDGLNAEWGNSVLLHPPFLARDELHGRGPTAWVKRGIEHRDKNRATVVAFLSVPAYLYLLLAAGAEIRPLGRVRCLHSKTGKPHSSPPFMAAFVLRPCGS